MGKIEKALNKEYEGIMEKIRNLDCFLNTNIGTKKFTDAYLMVLIEQQRYMINYAKCLLTRIKMFEKGMVEK